MKNALYIIFVLGIPLFFAFNGCSKKVYPDFMESMNTYEEVRSYNQRLLEILGQGECSICDTTEILKVMSVAINRTYDKRFPNSLEKVLYADNQFHGMFRVDKDKHGNLIISDKVKWCAKYIMENDPVLPPDVLGFLRIETIKTVRGRIWYNKIKDRIIFHDKYHSFYTL